MITIQEVHKYLNLVEIGMAKPILCPLDNQHTHMVSWIDEDDVVLLLLLLLMIMVMLL